MLACSFIAGYRLWSPAITLEVTGALARDEGVELRRAAVIRRRALLPLENCWFEFCSSSSS